MKVVILCGGQGTRLREETEYRPKPMVEVGGRPILWHIMKLYAHYGFKEFILCLGYRGHLIKDYFLNYEAMSNDFTISLGRDHEITYHGGHTEQDFKVTLVDTGQDNMTGSRIKQVERYIDTDEFMVTYGDGLSDVNILKLLDFHRSQGRLATLTTVYPTSRFGQVVTNEEHEVTEFIEKPQVSSLVSAGFFVFSKEVFSYLSLDKDCILEQQPLELLSQDRQLSAYKHDGFFYAMDTYREYLHLNNLWEINQTPWTVWKNEPPITTPVTEQANVIV